MLWNTSPSILVEEEQLIYPWTSLLAEFGGTLSLFLGLSFMTGVDLLSLLAAATAKKLKLV